MVSRETSLINRVDSGLFDNSLINEFLSGASFEKMTFDSAALFLNSFIYKLKSNILFTFEDEKTAYKFYLLNLGLNRDSFLFYPDIDMSEKVPGFNIESERYRAEALIKLNDKKMNYFCIGTTHSCNKNNIPIDLSSSMSLLSLGLGDIKDRDEIINLLSSWGYQKTDTVFEPKDFAWRGDILDIFPTYFRQPIRVVFDFGRIENIFIFDPITQLTLKNLSNLNIKGELIDKQFDDYINLIEYTNSPDVINCVVLGKKVDLLRGTQKQKRLLDVFPIYLNKLTLNKRIERAKEFITNNVDVYIVGGNKAKSLLSENFENAKWINGDIGTGFYSTVLNCVVISSSDVLNERKSIQKWAPLHSYLPTPITLNDISSLTNGDPVVHKMFGIGVFRGLTLQNSVTGERESVEIEYTNNSRVFVSIEKMDLIHRYVGSAKDPNISTLGSKKWMNEVAKTRKAVQLVATELIELYANKNRNRHFQYSSENDLNDALSNSFPFVETPDQKNAINDILSDMNSDSPVDRLICGDVGFGKTEVALRAIMKAVLSKKQSVFLCPTTILADQHFITCKERLESLGVTIGLLSRFKTKRQQSEIIELLRKKKIDVLIGTHRVLSQDVVIPELGLLIVDEEHRFGVNHKEKIRTMKQQVDVLTFSATPIPRTLQQSLVGIRDISLIQTPPRSRKPIETSVRFFDWDIINYYIERELDRDGQVYFLHNNIKSIPFITKKLQGSFPNVAVENIHGQMRSRELEHKILSFFKGGVDILVCTTIIESGLDVTNANCIIINDAQNFGLSQLYQIRGRVGRGHNQAHCLLLVPRKPLEQNAHMRLKTIEQFTSLGSGYDISIKDLEIRGAGSLFGYKQSGHISSMGFELYCELLKEEVNLVIGKNERLRFPNVVFGEDALINEYYITNPTQRLGFYNRFSRAETQKDVFKIKHELIDRFGKLPRETKNLVFIAETRVLFKNTSVSNIAINKTAVTLILENIYPYKTLDKLFAAVAGFNVPENRSYQFCKTKKGELSVSFSTVGIVASMALLLKCSQLFSVDNDK